MTHLNPEFRRNAWLQLSLHKLIAAPLILLTVLYLGYLTVSGWETVMHWSFWIFSLITAAYGAYLTSGSLIDEVQGRTWPVQRLTALSPWTMASGKVFGGPIFAWVVGVCCLAVIFLAPLLSGQTLEANIMTAPTATIIAAEYPLTTLILLISFAVSAHAFALVYSLVELQKTQELSRRAIIIPILTIIMATTLVGLLSTQIPDPAASYATVHWYYHDFHELYFFTGWFVANMLWLLVASYMLMRKELQFTNTPLVWLSFLIYQSVFLLGFSFDEKIENLTSIPIYNETFTIPLNSIRIAIIFVIFYMASYLMAAIERVDTLAIRITWQRQDSKKWWTLLKVLPRWLLTSMITMMLAAALLVSLHFEGYYQANFVALTIALIAFMLRDIGLFVFFDLSNKSRSVITAFVYLLLLYLIVPSVLKALQLHALMPFFYPNGKYGYLLTVAAPMLEAVLVWTFVRRAFNRC